MKNEPTNEKGSILVPVLAAGAIAAGLAFLFAPEIGNRAQEGLKRVADRFSQAIDIGKDA